MYISVNGILQDEKDIKISPTSEAFTYGYGLFETIKVENNRIYFLKEHYERLESGCKTLGLTLDYCIDSLEQYCFELISQNKLQSGALKILYGKNKENNWLILSIRQNHYREEDYNKGFSLTFSKSKRNPYSSLTYVKSNNYMENILERKKGLNQGFNEVLFENVHGSLCEGSISNLFFVRDKKIFTPSQDCGLLPGIMRKKVMELAVSLNIDLEQGKYTKGDILQAHEIFLTNSLMEIMPVSQLENKKFDLSKYKITLRLREQFRYMLLYNK